VASLWNTYYHLQSNIYLYCNILQYKYHGKRDKLCPTSGFFDCNKVEDLTSIKEPHYYKQERYVFIPISPEYPGDSGYINLPSLAAGNQVWQYSTTFLIGLHGINSCGKVVKLTNEKDVSLVRFPLSNTGSRSDDYH
jgi:hypothetical protein